MSPEQCLGNIATDHYWPISIWIFRGERENYICLNIYLRTYYLSTYCVQNTWEYFQIGRTTIYQPGFQHLKLQRDRNTNKHVHQQRKQMKCQVQPGSTGAKPLGTVWLPKLNFPALSCQSQAPCFAPPGQLPLSQLPVIKAEHPLFFYNPGGWQGTLSTFILCWTS